MAPTASGPAAVVIGLDCITGLQTARILARRGVPVVAIASDLTHFCCRTRVVERLLQADTASEALIQALERLGPQLKYRAVLFPCTDSSVLMVARHRERLAPWFHVVLPDTDVLETLQDKVRFAAFAERIGLPVPRTALLHDRADAERAAGDLAFPCILKPPLKTPRWEQNSSAKVHRVASGEELLEVYDRCSDWADVLMVQEWIEGSDSELFSCNCYFNRQSEPVVTFVARKLRQWPPRTGTSCLGEECRNDTVLDLTVRLFREAGYYGLGYLEVKRDVRTGNHYVIEANIGRPTGRSAIAEAGGVELLYAKYCDTLGLPLPDHLEQRYEGAKWIFWRQDLRSAWYYWKQGELTLTHWAHSLRGRKACAVLSWSDPGPFVADMGAVFREVTGSRRSKAYRNSPSELALPSLAVEQPVASSKPLRNV
jgi:D-aspartate ligase